MDLTMDYEFTKSLINELGEDKFFKLFQNIFTNFNLFRMSLDWINDKQYILKFKGENGDLIVSWK